VNWWPAHDNTQHQIPPLTPDTNEDFFPLLSHTFNDDNAHTFNDDNAHAFNDDKAHAFNDDNAHTFNYDNAHTFTYDNAHTFNYDNAHTFNYDNAHTFNYDNAHTFNDDNVHTFNSFRTAHERMLVCQVLFCRPRTSACSFAPFTYIFTIPNSFTDFL
jgi:hypothetical protein